MWRFSFFAFCFLFFAVSCKPSKAIKISGSTTIIPIVEQAISHYKLKNQDALIQIQAGGSGVGLTSVANYSVDIGMMSRDISKRELELLKSVQFKQTIIGYDAVSVAVSKEVYQSGIKQLTKSQIRKIYEGKITNWSELGGFDKKILCIDKELGRGTRHSFMKYVFGDAYAKTPGADIVSGSNNEELSHLSNSDNAIGMLSFAWLNEDVIGIGLEDDSANVIQPTIQNVVNGSYPISRDLVLVTTEKSKESSLQFVDFILSKEGQKIVKKLGFSGIN